MLIYEIIDLKNCIELIIDVKTYENYSLELEALSYIVPYDSRYSITNGVLLPHTKQDKIKVQYANVIRKTETEVRLYYTKLDAIKARKK